VTIAALNGFAGTVSFGVSGLPTGGSSSFNPTTVAGSGTTSMQISTTTSSPTGTSTLTVTATSGALSHTATTSLVVTANTTPPVNFPSGFTATGMQFNGHTLLNGTRLQLTDSAANNEVASAFWTTPVNIQTFTNDFTFQLTNPNADGFTFCIQNVGPTAIGNGGGGLGFAALGSSVAVKFDLFASTGETSNNSTGLYTKGAAPKTPETALGGGVNLHSGDTFQVHMTYDGKTLTMTITDTVVTTDTFTISFPINIPTTVGGNTAFVGFTAGTGSMTATQEILTWTFN
jgi:Legume lectin domain